LRLGKDMAKLHQSCPRSAEDVAQAIEIIFTGPTGKVPLALLNMLPSLRSGVVREFLDWYLAEERCGWRVKNLPWVDDLRQKRPSQTSRLFIGNTKQSLTTRMLVWILQHLVALQQVL
jgi:hypothetical protein